MSFSITAAAQLGPTLQGLRRSRKMTQTAVAAASGLKQKTISLLESEPNRCSVDSLVRYLSALRVALNLELRPASSSNVSKNDW